jgi:hypothetical protein
MEALPVQIVKQCGNRRVRWERETQKARKEQDCQTLRFEAFSVYNYEGKKKKKRLCYEYYRKFPKQPCK